MARTIRTRRDTKGMKPPRMNKTKPSKIVNKSKESKISDSEDGNDDQSQGATTFHPFPKLPLEIRLKIWGLMAPKQSHTLEQIKPLDYKPLHTYFEARPTPAVMHVCRESRAEFLYRDDKAANTVEAAERKGHALYAPMFPNPEGKMVFFSFEAEAVHLMSFKVAEPLVRSCLRTIIMGPTHELRFLMGIDRLHHTRAHTASMSWYANPASITNWALPIPFPNNNHTLVINPFVYNMFLWSSTSDNNAFVKYRQQIKYDFRDLVKFTALEKLVVMVTRQEVVPANPQEHIVWKTLEVVKAKYPDFKIPEVEFQRLEDQPWRACVI